MCRTAHRADGDRGAVIPIVALSLITLMVMTAFSIDIGRQILRRREAQAVADVIALDMSRLIDGRNVQSIEGDIKWSTTKSQSATRNNWSDSDVEAVTGHWDAASGAFTRLSGTAVPDAVQVTARDIVDFYFGTVIGASHGNVSRSSVALPSGKTFGGLGSVFAGFQYYRDGISAQYDLQAELRTKVLNATFSQQFGFSSSLPPIGIGLDAVGYKGISNGNVRLGDMAAAAGFGSVDEMLNADMTAKDLLNAEATALQNSGNSSDVAAGNE
ncbi:MAG: hypothetical protein QOH79_1471, partial [Acidimicrobiaceae bacterium]